MGHSYSGGPPGVSMDHPMVKVLGGTAHSRTEDIDKKRETVDGALVTTNGPKLPGTIPDEGAIGTDSEKGDHGFHM